MIDKKERYLASYPGMIKALQDATLDAKRERLGMYELGLSENILFTILR